MIIPPMAISGARIIMRNDMKANCCTWLTSLVVRVISVAVPTLSNSCSEKLEMWAKRRLRRSRGEADGHQRREPRAKEGRDHAAGRDDHHDAAHLQDVAGVALDHTDVDDARHQSGQGDFGERLDKDQDGGGDRHPPVGL